jgi:exportin-1
MMAEAKQNTDCLHSAQEIKILSNVLKTNVAACTSVGSAFILQLSKIYMDLLALYRIIGKLVSESVATQGLIATKTPKVRGWRTIKKEILKLVNTYVECTTDANTINTVNTNMVEPFLEAVLTDYNSNVDTARDAEVLNVIATIINKLQVKKTKSINVKHVLTLSISLDDASCSYYL